MQEEALWPVAVDLVTAAYHDLPQSLKERIAALATETVTLKEEHQRLMTKAGAAELCRDCQGVCCRFGKHHFTVVELLVYLAAGEHLFTPRFNSPVCPCHDGSGCMMRPGLRPFTCIIFVCEELDGLLSKPDAAAAAGIEKRLREINAEFELLLGNRFGNGLLLAGKRSLAEGRPIFQPTCME